MTITIRIEGENLNEAIQVTPKALENMAKENRVRNCISELIKDTLRTKTLTEVEEKILRIL